MSRAKNTFALRAIGADTLSPESRSHTERFAENNFEILVGKRITRVKSAALESDETGKMLPCLAPDADLPGPEIRYDHQASLGTLGAIIASVWRIGKD